MKIFQIEQAGGEQAVNIVEPKPKANGQPSVLYAGQAYVVLLSGKFGKGTTGVSEVDHTDPDVCAAIAASIRASVVDLAELDGLLAELYEQMTPPVPRRVGTPREFLGLFTDQEKVAFFAATRQNVEMEIWWAEASTGDFSLDHPSVEIGLGALMRSGLLSADRMAEILAADFDAA